ncbi:MAG: S66 peptidase family protein [Bradymonadaceae bacterium]
MIQPPALKPGDRVAILSPAGPVNPTLLAEGLKVLESWGLDAVLCRDVYARRPPADYLAGDDSCRVNALHRALSDPSIAAVICSRGGYGTMRLLPHLDTDMIRQSPKLLVGFSDITALHIYFAGILGVTTLHGPVVKSLPLHHQDPHESLGHLQTALFGTRPRPFHVEGLRTVRPGKSQGRIIGGNLSLITNLLATEYCPNFAGMILILEEIGEVDYRLDRLFTALRLAEKTRGLAGLVLGDFTDCSGVYVPEVQINRFVEDLASEFDCPVVADFPCGHGSRNVPIPMGVEVELDADAGRLTFRDDAVSPLM